MIACLQRVGSASVTVGGETVARIGPGCLVLLGVAADDKAEEAQRLADKVASLRIYDDAAGKMNLGLADTGGEVLVVSQFTLLADCRKGRRPSFAAAARPEMAEALYEQFVAWLRERGLRVVTGRFRQQMQVSLVNDGPVTIWLDTATLR